MLNPACAKSWNAFSKSKKMFFKNKKEDTQLSIKIEISSQFTLRHICKYIFILMQITFTRFAWQHQIHLNVRQQTNLPNKIKINKIRNNFTQNINKMSERGIIVLTITIMNLCLCVFLKPKMLKWFFYTYIKGNNLILAIGIIRMLHFTSEIQFFSALNTSFI